MELKMNGLLIVLIILSSAMTQASCKVFIPVKEFLHAGYTIYFDFETILKNKNMEETNEELKADYTLVANGFELEERYFNYAATNLTINDMSGKSHEYQERVRCLTQLCGVSDFSKSFNKVFRKLLKIHPSCK
jgi:hypothetical protein